MDCSVKPSCILARLAFKLALNRQLAVKSVDADSAVPTSDLPIPPRSYPTIGPIPGEGYDPAQARRLCPEGAGYPKGMDITLNFHRRERHGPIWPSVP